MSLLALGPRPRRALLAAAVALHPAILHAEAEFHGDLGLTYGQGVELDEPVLSRIEANLLGRYNASDCDTRAALHFRRDQYLDPAPSDELNLREGSLTCRQGGWLVSAGRQSVAWGKADAFPVLDVVHPFDLREFVLDGLESSRLPLTMIRLERTVSEGGFLQLLLIPERRSDRLPDVEGRFAPALLPQTAYNAVASNDGVPPAWGADSTQLGLKWEHAGTALGYTLNLLDQWAPEPYYVWDPASGNVGRKFNRRQVLGGSFDYAFDDWVVRGEAAYNSELWLDRKPEPGPVPALGPDYGPYRQLTWMLGVDRFLADWLLGLQLFEARNLGGGREPIVGRDNRLATLLATRSFLQDRLELKAFLARDLSERGAWLNFEIGYSPQVNLKLTLGADFLSGDLRSSFGRIRDQDRVKVGLKASF